MDWKTFFADIISTIAWPVVVMFIIWQLKDKVADLLPRIKKFKFKDTELEFIEAIEEFAEDIKDDEPIKSDEIAKNQHMLYTLANVSSRSAIIEAYRLLEVEAVKAVEKAYPESAERNINNPRELMEKLKDKILDGAELSRFYKLKKLRNQAVHIEGFSLTGEPISAYIELSLRLTDTLEKYNKS